MFQALACSRHSVSKTEQRLEQKSETARETFSLLCYYSAVYHTFCFTNGMPETGYSVTNHNHYNFFKCDWCINCFIFHLSFCTALNGQRNQTVGRNYTPVIGQLKQPIILSPLSQIHQSQS